MVPPPPTRLTSARDPVSITWLGVMVIVAGVLLLVVPAGWPLWVSVAVMTIAVGASREHGRWIEVDPTGVRHATLLGSRHVGWASIPSIERGRDRAVVVVLPRAPWRHGLELDVASYGARLFDVLREAAPPGVYRLSAEDERALIASVRSPHREPVRARVTMTREPRASDRGGSYRDGSPRDGERATQTFSLCRPFAPERRAFRRAFAVSMAFGISTMVAAGLVTAGHPSLAAFVVVGALVVAALSQRHFLGVALGLRALRRKLIERLGPEVVLDPRGMLVSLDRRARVRQMPCDLDDLVLGLHLHVERLDAEGLVESSAIVRGLDLGLPADARPWTLRETARVPAREPSSLDDDTWPREPRLLRTDGEAIATLVIEHGPDGAVLSRFGVDEGPLGDTFHEDADAARRQAAHETEHAAWQDTMEGR